MSQVKKKRALSEKVEQACMHVIPTVLYQLSRVETTGRASCCDVVSKFLFSLTSIIFENRKGLAVGMAMSHL